MASRPALVRLGALMSVFLAGAMVVAPCWSAGAEELDPWQEMISPDRPGAATPPSVMGRGIFQIETAFEAQSARPPDSPAVSTQDFPTLLRLGLGHRLEVRVESNTLSLEQAVTGFADMSVEAKWLALDRPAGKVPSVAFLPAVSLPTGTSDFTVGKVQAGLTGLLGWILPSGTSLSLDANVSRVVESTDGPYVWQLASQAAFQTPLRRDWAISGDLFVTAPLVSSSTAPWGLDAGVEYYPNPDTQLDLVAIQTFTEPGSATAVQLGFSRRFSFGVTHR